MRSPAEMLKQTRAPSGATGVVHTDEQTLMGSSEENLLKGQRRMHQARRTGTSIRGDPPCRRLGNRMSPEVAIATRDGEFELLSAEVNARGGGAQMTAGPAAPPTRNPLVP